MRGQIVIITGASQGIGEAIARLLAPLGMNLVLCARQIDKLKKLSAELKAKSLKANTSSDTDNILILSCDVQDPKQVQTVVDETIKHFGRIDVLINNAGVAPKQSLLQELSVEDIDRTIDTNLKGSIYFMRAVLPILIQQHHDESSLHQDKQAQIEKSLSTIININSVAGQTAFPYWSVYDASKFGLRAITEAVAEEQRSNGIRITGIYPGAVDTPIWDGVGGSRPDPKGMLTAESIAESVLYILRQPPGLWIEGLTLRPLQPSV